MLILTLCLLLLAFTLSVALVLNFGRPELITAGHALPAGKNNRDRNQILKQPVYERLLFPVALALFNSFNQLLPITSQSWVSRKLAQAGYHNTTYSKLVFGFQILFALGGFFISWFLMTALFHLPLFISAVMMLFYTLAGFGLPLAWLQQQARKRQSCIYRTLPDMLDLLVISVEAGLGLDIAIRKITNLDLGKTAEPLRKEFQHYLMDVSFGKSRNEALLDIAERNNSEDLKVLVNALVQSHDLGSSIGHTLRVQSETLRNKRLQEAEEKASKIPVKMVMPIYIFLFPAIFVCIFGPVGMVLAKTLGKIFSNTGILH